MKWIVENWMVIVAMAAAMGCTVAAVYHFVGMPTDKQQAKVKEWLVWACIEAEKTLQSGTGQLKLREVWNMFCAVPAFTWVAKFISFENFEKWVKEALKSAKEMLIKNQNLAEYVYGDNAETEIAKIKRQLQEACNENITNGN